MTQKQASLLIRITPSTIGQIADTGRKTECNGQPITASKRKAGRTKDCKANLLSLLHIYFRLALLINFCTFNKQFADKKDVLQTPFAKSGSLAAT